MTVAAAIETIGIPASLLLIALCYAMMYHYVRINKVTLSSLTNSRWMDYRIGFYIFELPSKYYDSYKSKTGKVGPWLKLLFCAYAVFIIFGIFALTFNVLIPLSQHSHPTPP
jgi:hypothetical protein